MLEDQDIYNRLRHLLKQYWGYNDFRPGQWEIIASVIKNKATLAVLTTGGGKSICYQIPGIAFPGLVIVISPLISLMQDQVQRLQGLGINAAVYNSTISKEKKILIEEEIYSGKIKFLYLSPEALCNKRLQKLLREVEVGLVAVDEAHCISMWGHDFRPTYQQIPANLKAAGQEHVRIAAFTATATTKVRNDICRYLNINKASNNTFISSFARNNIHISVFRHDSHPGMLDLVRSRLEYSPVLVYCSSRERCELLAKQYKRFGLKSERYHGGMDNAERAGIQSQFINDRIAVLFATNAFGMGVDKPNLYTVIHDQIPDSIENYYQEAGRAGRDGMPSQGIVYLNWSGINLRTQMLENNFINKQLANSIYNYLCSHSNTVTTDKILSDIEGINAPKLARFLLLAERGGIISYEIIQGQIKYKLLKPNIILLGRHIRFDHEYNIFTNGKRKLREVVTLFSRDHCRQHFILKYFGEDSRPCGNCDYCRA